MALCLLNFNFRAFFKSRFPSGSSYIASLPNDISKVFFSKVWLCYKHWRSRESGWLVYTLFIFFIYIDIDLYKWRKEAIMVLFKVFDTCQLATVTETNIKAIDRSLNISYWPIYSFIFSRCYAATTNDFFS